MPALLIDETGVKGDRKNDAELRFAHVSIILRAVANDVAQVEREIRKARYIRYQLPRTLMSCYLRLAGPTLSEAQRVISEQNY